MSWPPWQLPNSGSQGEGHRRRFPREEVKPRQRSIPSLSTRQDGQRAASSLFTPGSALVHAHRPASRSVLYHTSPEASTKSCTWVPEHSGCGFTYLVRGSQRTLLESGFHVSGQWCEGATKISADPSHVTRGLWQETAFVPWMSQGRPRVSWMLLEPDQGEGQRSLNACCLHTQCGAQTHDPKIKSCLFYPLSQPGASVYASFQGTPHLGKGF